MVDANFIFILVFISPYSRSVWHPSGCLILHMVYFISFCVTISLHIFIRFIPHCRYLFPCTFWYPEFGSQCCQYKLTEPGSCTENAHVHTQYTAMPFGVKIFKIEDSSQCLAWLTPARVGIARSVHVLLGATPQCHVIR